MIIINTNLNYWITEYVYTYKFIYYILNKIIIIKFFMEWNIKIQYFVFMVINNKIVLYYKKYYYIIIK